MTRKLLRTRLSAWVSAEQALLSLKALFPEAYTIWLDAGPLATEGLSYLSFSGGRVLTDNVEVDAATGGDIFTALRSALSHDAGIDTSAARADGFSLGWVGWFGYELASLTAGVPVAEAPTDDARFVYVDWALEFDHAAHTVDVLALVDTAAEFDSFVEEIAGQLLKPGYRPVEHEAASPKVVWRHEEGHYRDLVQTCLDHITAGDAYQLCLTNQAQVTGDFHALEVYLRLRQVNPSHHGGLLDFGDTALLSSSPEVFLRVTADGRVMTKPIKGTRPRAHDAGDDALLASELQANDKERAENLMIVDLMRNDLGRVAERGTVSVDALLEVETYPHVHQLVSTVSAQLAPGLTAVDAMESCFPAGSMTGAPKISAMSILNTLEEGPRGIYSGAFGYLGIDGASDLAMVIRSIVLTPGLATVGTGGGITSGSIPQAEYDEMRLKAEPLMRVLGAI